MMGQPDLGGVYRALSRAAVFAFAVGVLALSQGSSDAAGDDAGLRFSMHCSESNDAGGATCALVVSGLPAPLAGEATVLVVSSDVGADEGAGRLYSEAASTGVASAAPSTWPGPPVLVSSHLPPPPPELPPLALQVPAPPPRSL